MSSRKRSIKEALQTLESLAVINGHFPVYRGGKAFASCSVCQKTLWYREDHGRWTYSPWATIIIGCGNKDLKSRVEDRKALLGSLIEIIEASGSRL